MSFFLLCVLKEVDYNNTVIKPPKKYASGSQGIFRNLYFVSCSFLSLPSFLGVMGLGGLVLNKNLRFCSCVFLGSFQLNEITWFLWIRMEMFSTESGVCFISFHKTRILNHKGKGYLLTS